MLAPVQLMTLDDLTDADCCKADLTTKQTFLSRISPAEERLRFLEAVKSDSPRHQGLGLVLAHSSLNSGWDAELTGSMCTICSQQCAIACINEVFPMPIM